jgi:hypothetical protein
MPENFTIYVIDGDITTHDLLKFTTKNLESLLIVNGNIETENLFLEYSAFIIVTRNTMVKNCISNKLGDAGAFFVNGDLEYKKIEGINNPIYNQLKRVMES